MKRSIVVLAGLALAGWISSAGASEVGPAPVKSGVPVRVLSYASYNPSTCYFGPLPILRIVRQPAHGTLVLDKHSYPSRVERCAGKTFVAATAVYRSNPGFRGRDEMEIDAESEIYGNSQGMRTDRVHIVVDVK